MCSDGAAMYSISALWTAAHHRIPVTYVMLINAAYRISKRWAITARGQVFSLDRENEFSGEIGDFHADIQYRWRKNFAVGLGYSRLFANVDIIDADQPFMFDMDASGPELFMRASF